MRGRWRVSQYSAMSIAVVAVIVFFLPPPDGAPASVMRAAGVVVLTVGLWATAAFPEYLTSIIFFLLAAALAIAPPEIVFSGFHSSAVWMVFGGLVIGVAVQTTGFGARVARAMVARFQGSYISVLGGLVVLAALMAFVMPSSTGRIVVLLPIVLALADRLGFAVGSNGRVGMTLAVGAGAIYPAFGVLPANVPNLGLLGAAESVHGIRITYVEYLVLHFPVIGLLSTAFLPFVLRYLFPDRPRPQAPETDAEPVGRDETVLMVVLALALVLWMTDFAHGISPAWIAMGAAVVFLLPRVGIVPPNTVVERVNFAPWFFVAGVIGMSVVVTASGLGDLIGRALFSLVRLTPGQDGANFAAVAGIGMGVGLISGMPGQPAIMTALAPGLSQGTGWPLLTVLMAQAPSWSLALFPYQLPPMIVTMYLGNLRVAQVMKLLAIMVLFF